MMGGEAREFFHFGRDKYELVDKATAAGPLTGGSLREGIRLISNYKGGAAAYEIEALIRPIKIKVQKVFHREMQFRLLVDILALRFNTDLDLSWELAEYCGVTGMGAERQAYGAFRVLTEVRGELRAGFKRPEREGHLEEAHEGKRAALGAGAVEGGAQLGGAQLQPCWPFLMTGSCARAEGCRFAHEARTPETKCPFMAMASGCKRGSAACQFKH